MTSSTQHEASDTAQTTYQWILEHEITEGLRELERPTTGLLISGVSAGLDVSLSLFLMVVILALAHRGSSTARWQRCSAPLDFYMWVVWKSWTVNRGTAYVPLFGDCGLTSQLGTTEYSARRRLRQILIDWIMKVKALWPDCPAQISEDGRYLQVRSCRTNPAVRTVEKAVTSEGSGT